MDRSWGLLVDAHGQGGARDIWAELPKRSGSYQVEVQVLDPAGEKLDYKHTRRFTLRAARS